MQQGPDEENQRWKHGEPSAGSQQRGVPPHAPATSEDAKRKIVELWLSGETNDARLILGGFKIGLEEGRRVRGNAKLTQAASEASD